MDAIINILLHVKNSKISNVNFPALFLSHLCSNSIPSENVKNQEFADNFRGYRYVM